MPALNIHSSPFSFIRVNEPGADEIMLPAYGNHRAAFQFSVNGIADIVALNMRMKDEATGTISTFTGGVGATAVMLESEAGNWKTGFVQAPDEPIPFAVGKVFRYVILDGAGNEKGTTNPFIMVEEELFTSVLSYRCNTSGFGFVYSACDTDLINKVRLPFYLLKPEHPKKRSVYRKSNGVNKMLSAQIDKEYRIVTEQLPDLFHECMAMALSHEDITIENANIRERTVKVIEAEDYKVNWPEEDDVDFAQGGVRVKVATFGFNSSNCDTDDCGCVPVSFVSPVTLPTAWQSTPYTFSFDVNGDAPFSIIDEGIPDWMTVSVSGNTISLSGTPPDAGTAFVGFAIENCGGINAISIDQTINIAS